MKRIHRVKNTNLKNLKKTKPKKIEVEEGTIIRGFSLVMLKALLEDADLQVDKVVNHVYVEMLCIAFIKSYIRFVT